MEHVTKITFKTNFDEESQLKVFNSVDISKEAVLDENEMNIVLASWKRDRGSIKSIIEYSVSKLRNDLELQFMYRGTIFAVSFKTWIVSKRVHSIVKNTAMKISSEKKIKLKHVSKILTFLRRHAGDMFNEDHLKECSQKTTFEDRPIGCDSDELISAMKTSENYRLGVECLTSTTFYFNDGSWADDVIIKVGMDSLHFSHSKSEAVEKTSRLVADIKKTLTTDNSKPRSKIKILREHGVAINSRNVSKERQPTVFIEGVTTLVSDKCNIFEVNGVKLVSDNEKFPYVRLNEWGFPSTYMTEAREENGVSKTFYYDIKMDRELKANQIGTTAWKDYFRKGRKNQTVPG
eukprot:Nk52_evm14s2256 gene=Nk52_evmTU14s2256